MDTVAAVMAPHVVDLGSGDLVRFLGSGLRVVQVHSDGRPFGWLLKGLLHGSLGSALRCARLDATALHPQDEAAQDLLRPWIHLAGEGGRFPPPNGYYLLRGRGLLGFHPELEPTGRDLMLLASVGAKGAAAWLKARDATQAGRTALDGLPEVDLLRFFQRAACGTTPLRAPAAGDRRRQGDRRQQQRGAGRRESEQMRSELEEAFAVLGVGPQTPLRDITRARSRLMRQRHPDRVGDDPKLIAEATRRAVKINAAWATIRKADTAGWLQ